VRVLRLRAEPIESARRRLEQAGIERSFFLCATPRSGSNLLADLLAGTGLVGHAGERFNHSELPTWAPRRPGEYLAFCAGDAKDTGVFGLKLHWDQLERFLALLRSFRDAPEHDGDLIDAVFPSPRYVHLRREDSVAQGVSWWKARTSGAWRGGREAPREPVFDFDGIDERVKRAQEHDREWSRWFDANGIEPLELNYEALVGDPARVVEGTLRFLGVDVPETLVLTPGTKRQFDEVNEEWIRRYRELSDSTTSR
jgi:LPS sulfotransferase NodH